MPFCFEVKNAQVLFGKSMLVAVNVAAFAFYSQKSYFFITIVTSFSVFLLLFWGLQIELFNRLDKLNFGLGRRSNCYGRRLDAIFFLFLLLLFSKIKTKVLKTWGTEPLVCFCAMKELADTAHSIFSLSMLSLDVHK